VLGKGVPRFVSWYCNFDADVQGFINRRHFNSCMHTEVAPPCPVTTGLLIALHHTAHGKDDLVDRVMEMDNTRHPFSSSDENQRGQVSALQRFRLDLKKKICATLCKVTGQGKDR
jgi:hypothetical protein